VRELAGPDIAVPGWVEDFPGLLRGADVFVAPMRFVAGVQNKVLEAMAAGTPVVTSPAVASAIGAEDGVHLCTGRTPEELAAHVIALIRDPARAHALGAAGRALVAERFSWSSVLERLAAGRTGAP
jgi:glycosyltransferase involved in cell wall biosynthesis